MEFRISFSTHERVTFVITKLRNLFTAVSVNSLKTSKLIGVARQYKRYTAARREHKYSLFFSNLIRPQK